MEKLKKPWVLNWSFLSVGKCLHGWDHFRASGIEIEVFEIEVFKIEVFEIEVFEIEVFKLKVF